MSDGIGGFDCGWQTGPVLRDWVRGMVSYHGNGAPTARAACLVQRDHDGSPRPGNPAPHYRARVRNIRLVPVVSAVEVLLLTKPTTWNNYG